MTSPCFQNLIKTVALSTTAIFTFSPTDDEVRTAYAKANRLPVEQVPKENQSEELRQGLALMKEKIITMEKNKPFYQQKTVGDASESGLIKFLQPLLMQAYGGDYEQGL